MIVQETFHSTISSKIDGLFRNRRIMDQAAHLGINDTDFYSQLEKLQLSIYHLDKYFEMNWAIDPQRTTECWSAILGNLQMIIGIQAYDESAESYVREIRRYQAIEESLRMPLLRLPGLMEYYCLKTCDVRLMRHLLTQRGVVNCDRRAYNKAWDLFDLISEVCDDLEDLNEDIRTYNGNRFLLGIQTDGIDKTLDNYKFMHMVLKRQIHASLVEINKSDMAHSVLLYANEHIRLLNANLVMVEARKTQIIASHFVSLLTEQRRLINTSYIPKQPSTFAMGSMGRQTY